MFPAAPGEDCALFRVLVQWGVSPPVSACRPRCALAEVGSRASLPPSQTTTRPYSCLFQPQTSFSVLSPPVPFPKAFKLPAAAVSVSGGSLWTCHPPPRKGWSVVGYFPSRLIVLFIFGKCAFRALCLFSYLA